MLIVLFSDCWNRSLCQGLSEFYWQKWKLKLSLLGPLQWSWQVNRRVITKAVTIENLHFSRHEIPPTVICCIKKDNSLKCIAQPLKARGERGISIVATYIFLSRTSTKGRRQDSVPVRRSVISLRRLVRSQKLAIFSYGCCPISIYGGWSGQMFSESFVCCNMYGANFSGVLSTFGPQLLK